MWFGASSVVSALFKHIDRQHRYTFCDIMFTNTHILTSTISQRIQFTFVYINFFLYPKFISFRWCFVICLLSVRFFLNMYVCLYMYAHFEQMHSQQIEDEGKLQSKPNPCHLENVADFKANRKTLKSNFNFYWYLFYCSGNLSCKIQIKQSIWKSRYNWDGLFSHYCILIW